VKSRKVENHAHAFSWFSNWRGGINWLFIYYRQP